MQFPPFKQKLFYVDSQGQKNKWQLVIWGKPGMSWGELCVVITFPCFGSGLLSHSGVSNVKHFILEGCKWEDCEEFCGRFYYLLLSLRRHVFIFYTDYSYFPLEIVLGKKLLICKYFCKFISNNIFPLKIFSCIPFFKESHLSNSLLSSFLYLSIYFSANKLKINE